MHFLVPYKYRVSIPEYSDLSCFKFLYKKFLDVTSAR